MIKREHIKQAIDAISRRSPEIGYSLDQMLGMGVIDTAAGADQAMDGDNLHFVFDDEKVLVNKVLFFNEGIVPIEQGLVIKVRGTGQETGTPGQERVPSITGMPPRRSIGQDSNWW